MTTQFKAIFLTIFVAVASTATGIVVDCPNGSRPTYALEAVLIQDASSSFKNDIPIVTNLLPELTRDMEAAFPGTRFGVTSFSDKPISPFGWRGDYCYEKATALTTDFVAAIKKYKQIEVKNGGDKPENQLGALLDSALDPKMKWSTGLSHAGLPVLKVAILATDADYHTAQDGDWLKTHNGSFGQSCAKTDYPAVSQVKAALDKQGVIPMFLVKNRLQDYQDLLTKLGHPQSYALELGSESKDIVKVVSRGLEEIVCRTTTTTEPTTTTSTTTKSTTTTTTTTEPTTTTSTTTKPTTTTTTTTEPTTTTSTTAKSTTTTTEPTTTTTEPTTTTTEPTTTTTEPTTTTTEPTTTTTTDASELSTQEPSTDKPTTSEPVTEKPVTEKPVTEKPVTEKPVTEKPVTEKPVTEKPVTEKPVTEKPATEEPTTTTEEKKSGATVGVIVGAAAGGVGAAAAIGAVAYKALSVANPSSVLEGLDGDFEMVDDASLPDVERDQIATSAPDSWQ